LFYPKLNPAFFMNGINLFMESSRKREAFLLRSEIQIRGIVVIVGGYGSGKTEIAINLAMNRKRAGMDVRIADLDLVNPYFRTREAKSELEKLGIGVVLPPFQYLQADLPILDRSVSALIRNPAEISILDVGGDPVGATVLAALSDAFHSFSAMHVPLHMLQVVNPFRPFTETIKRCFKMREAIETVSKQTITGIIGNPNLIEETTSEDVIRGYEFIQILSKESALPVEFIAIEEELTEQVDLDRITCPVLRITRQMVPPWKRTGLKTLSEKGNSR
jgi:hypothetical protein